MNLKILLSNLSPCNKEFHDINNHLWFTCIHYTPLNKIILKDTSILYINQAKTRNEVSQHKIFYKNLLMEMFNTMYVYLGVSICL